MKRIALALLSLCVLFSLCARADLKMGPSVTTNDLASHLGVLCWSFNYTAAKPFKKLAVRLAYYERNAEGKFSGKFLQNYEIGFQKPATKSPLKIFVDSTKSTIIDAGSSSYGEGFPFDAKKNAAFFSTTNPPEATKDGKYILWQSAPQENASFSPGVLSDKANAYLELELVPTF